MSDEKQIIKKDVELTKEDIENQAKQFDMFQEYVKEQLKDTVHYYKFEKYPKPSLSKAGAEKILSLYNCYAETVEIKEKELKNNHYAFDITIKIISRKTGNIVGYGNGSCNSSEKKYLYSSSNPQELRNTILKMAEKRAVIDGTLYLGNISEFFTQDLEDIQDAKEHKETLIEYWNKLAEEEDTRLIEILITLLPDEKYNPARKDMLEKIEKGKWTKGEVHKYWKKIIKIINVAKPENIENEQPKERVNFEISKEQFYLECAKYKKVINEVDYKKILKKYNCEIESKTLPSQFQSILMEFEALINEGNAIRKE